MRQRPSDKRFSRFRVSFSLTQQVQTFCSKSIFAAFLRVRLFIYFRGGGHRSFREGGGAGVKALCELYLGLFHIWIQNWQCHMISFVSKALLSQHISAWQVDMLTGNVAGGWRIGPGSASPLPNPSDSIGNDIPLPPLPLPLPLPAMFSLM